jgi:hypothetical protein
VLKRKVPSPLPPSKKQQIWLTIFLKARVLKPGTRTHTCILEFFYFCVMAVLILS